MDQELLNELIGLGADDELIAQLLRERESAENEIDATRGKDYLINAGRVNVANPWGAVADMFVRGQAKKRADKAAQDLYRQTVRQDEKMAKAFNQANYGDPVAPADAGLPARSPQVKPPGQFPMPQMPQVTAPPAQPQARPTGITTMGMNVPQMPEVQVKPLPGVYRPDAANDGDPFDLLVQALGGKS